MNLKTKKCKLREKKNCEADARTDNEQKTVEKNCFHFLLKKKKAIVGFLLYKH